MIGFKRKQASLVLAVMFMMMTILSPLPALASGFNDTKGHWAEEAMDQWHAYGVVQGYNGDFRPNDAVTRAEFASMIHQIMKYIQTGENAFSDMSASKWYYDAMMKLSAAGVMNGENGKAHPDREITRQEAAVMIAEAFDIEGSDSAADFNDQQDIARWAQSAVNALVAEKVINGLPGGSFKPLGHLTRAEAVTLFNQLVQMLITEPGEYSEDVQGNLVINTADVVLKDMTISGDLYITQGVGEGDITLNNVIVEGSVFAQGGGENSIIFNSVDVKGALVVNKYNGKLRVLATGNTSVSVTKMSSGALLVTKELTGGGFDTIEIPADVIAGHEIILDGNFNKVVNHSDSNAITANGTINELVTEVPTQINGNAVIQKVTSESGAEVTVNQQPVQSEPPVTGTNPSSGGNNNNDDDSSDDDGRSRVAVTGVIINETDVSLHAGETKQLTATVQPANATNKTVTWSVYGGDVDSVTIDANGLLTAVSAGNATIQAVTNDGGKTDELNVEVLHPGIKVGLSTFEGNVINPDADIDAAIIANSSQLSVQSLTESLDRANQYEAMVVAEQALQPSEEPDGLYANVVVTLKDQEGNTITDTTGFTTTVTSATYSYQPVFGQLLSEGSHEGSFVAQLKVSEPESIEHYTIEISHEDYEELTINLVYVPADAAYVTNIAPISGDLVIGSELTAGEVSYVGTPENDQLFYTWYTSSEENGAYSRIEDANGPVYELKEADSGQYIRVQVFADQISVAGSALSEPVGPVTEPVDASDLFTAIEAGYLSDNPDSSNVIMDLNLMTSLEAFPGVILAWQSSNPAVITNGGAVTRDDQDDQFVSLTVTLSGSITGTKTYEIIVRANGTDHVDIVDYIDSYFADGYPQAYVKNGTVWVRYMLNAPAEVYMVVNTINGHRPSSVKSVLEGHAGEDNDITYVDNWPYFNINSDQVNQLQEFDTGEALSDGEARIEFVIQNKSQDYLSNQVTTILFEQETVSALDTNPPYHESFFINDALNTIYLYYDEWLNVDSKPSITDYELNYGTVDSISIVNYPETGGMASSYVKLEVSGIVEANKDELHITYTGDALRDMSDAQNQADTFEQEEVLFINEQIERVTISSDRQSMIVDIIPGWNPKDNSVDNSNDETLFTIEVDGQDQITPNAASYSYSSDWLSYTLKFDSPLPAGALNVKMDTSGIKNWAHEMYPAELTSQDVVEIPAPGVPTASYADGYIKLTFVEGFEFDHGSFNAAGLTLNVDQAEYALRGFIINTRYSGDNHVLSIDLNDPYAAHIKQAVDNGSDVQIKYVKVNGEDDHQLADAAGALIPDFSNVTVTK